MCGIIAIVSRKPSRATPTADELIAGLDRALSFVGDPDAGAYAHPVVVSGVISPSALRNPLINVRRRRRDREWLAATLQVLIPALSNVNARVQFGRPIYAEPGATIGAAVIEETRLLMEIRETA